MSQMTSLTWTDLDKQAVRYGRVLAADAVQKAGNGHPGTAISLAPAAYLLFQKVMKHDPADPAWLGRDRFVLSIGHSSLTLYTQLFYAGYGLEMADLEALRTYESKTPGHPEYGWTPGVEMTTGPLGQGLASSVGMAMAARRERGMFDPEAEEGTSPFDHFVYVICGEGDLEEGVTSEASSLAGTQKLGNLIVIFDDNQISIEDDTVIAFSEDVLARYEAYGWHTQHVQWRKPGADYVEDVDALYNAIKAAQAETDRPSIIKLSTIIAWPSPTKQNTGASHGSALGAEEIRGLKEALGLDPEASFQMPEEVLSYARGNAAQRAADAHEEWDATFGAWGAAHPDKAELLTRLQARELPSGWEASLPEFEAGTSIATRAASGKVLTALKDVLPELWGGSADLAGSNNTTMAGEPSFLPEDRSSAAFSGHKYGRTLHFGIREHAMGSILNGISLHGLTRPYGGTFFVFSDYMRPAVRLAALMHVPSIFVWTHDSVGVGEDGPTHQPIEHLWSYRAIPGLDIVRPADANETSYAWRGILERDTNPSGIVLSRQNLPVFERGAGDAQGDELASAEGVLRGGYVLADSQSVDVVLIATGSEVAVALEARKELAAEGIGARVVSMPCIEWFETQDADYRESVLPAAVKARVSVEAGSTFGWKYIIGDAGVAVGIDHYGASASGNYLMKEYGMTAANVVAAAKQSLAQA
ncbi:Transketolase [Arcanobacterium haemolyticum]|uniref:Transketolase n=2 Tax=Arcanobacterium haemolyticum TaxID=28264 RepID=D7BNV7_ARCHD|nr:transketolase [Arcanobacterium haemolyticum DSM 20595]SQH28660.1 Transketolase [Arcanobacterium haemolyticum]